MLFNCIADQRFAPAGFAADVARFADQQDDAPAVSRAVPQHADRLFGGVDHVVGVAAGLDLAHGRGDLVGIGSEVLQGADAMVEGDHRGLALVAQNVRAGSGCRSC